MKVILLRYSILALLLSFSGIIFAQQPTEAFDTTKISSPDSLQTYKGKRVITLESYTKRFDPRKALLYSAVFPGAGQAYNKKYWKLPIVYGGFYLGIKVINEYQTLYAKYKNELFIILNEPTIKKSASGYTEDQLRNLINTYRRQRDYFTALTALWYILQMVDAHVDTHLKEFDLNPQLQVRLEPSIQNNPLTGKSTGLSLTLRF